MKTVKIYTEEIMSTTYAFTDITVMYTGLSFVVAGTLDPGRLMLAAYQFDGEPIFAPFLDKMIILPRQARDKHRENSKNLIAFP